MMLTRRAIGLGAAAALLPAGARGQEVTSHGLSAFGNLKYPVGFPHFDYARPDAPKGGVFSQVPQVAFYNQALSTFDTLHIFVLRGNGAAGVERCFASLMARAWDEPDALYSLAADAVTVSSDRLSYRFHLRSGLTFHDGSPLTAADVAWTFMTLKQKGHPLVAQPLGALIEASAESAETVQVRFSDRRGRTLPLFVASLPIFSRTWWSTRDFVRSSLEPPLGSGPYRVGAVSVGSSIELERVAGWWGDALPSQIGQNNFLRLRYEYFRDRDVAFEAFKARAYLFREEVTSRIWATGYDFPAARDGRIRRETLADHTPSGAQGWYLNTRRPQLADPNVRQAIGLLFDFEWTNKTLMYGLYARTASIFQNSELMAQGTPSPAERALLEPFRPRLAPEVFGPAVLPPVSDGSGQDRHLLHQAGDLLREAGWTVRDGALRNAAGQVFELEFLDSDGSLERHTAPFIQNLRRIGIQAAYRVVDAAQYEARLTSFDFDVTMRRYSFTGTPGEDLRASLTSPAAAAPGSQNLAGLADPVVDGLVEAVIAASTRVALTDACRALDRVLRASFFWVPCWYTAEHRLAYWDVLGRPEQPPRYASGAPETWWAKT